MKKLELILGGITVLAAILYLLQIPIVFFLLIISVQITATFYFLLSFALLNGIGFKGMFKKESFKQTNGLKITIAALTGWILSLVILGSLFSLSHWPGDIMLITGLMMAAIVLIICGFLYFREKNIFYNRVILRTLFWGAIGVLVYFLN
jgi:hypothetical protein